MSKQLFDKVIEDNGTTFCLWHDGQHELIMVLEELIAALKKHPFFADVLCDSEVEWSENVQQLRNILKKQIAEGRASVEAIIMCELYEAFEAYQAGDLEATEKELAQVASVAIRAIRMVRAERSTGRSCGKCQHSYINDLDMLTCDYPGGLLHRATHCPHYTPEQEAE